MKIVLPSFKDDWRALHRKKPLKAKWIGVWPLSRVLVSFYRSVPRPLWNPAVRDQGRMGTNDLADPSGPGLSVGGWLRLRQEEANTEWMGWMGNGPLLGGHRDTILHGFWSVLPFLRFAWFQNSANLLFIIWEYFIQVLVSCPMPPRLGAMSLPSTREPVGCSAAIGYKLLRKSKAARFVGETRLGHLSPFYHEYPVLLPLPTLFQEHTQCIHSHKDLRWFAQKVIWILKKTLENERNCWMPSEESWVMKFHVSRFHWVGWGESGVLHGFPQVT